MIFDLPHVVFASHNDLSAPFSSELTSSLLSQQTAHCHQLINRPATHGSQDSLLVKVLDSELKGYELKPWHKGLENFLLQTCLCVLTLIRCLFHPRVTTVARKRPQSFCQKCRWQVTCKHAYILDPTK